MKIKSLIMCSFSKGKKADSEIIKKFKVKSM